MATKKKTQAKDVPVEAPKKKAVKPKTKRVEKKAAAPAPEKPLTLAERFVSEFSLVNDGTFIAFADSQELPEGSPQKVHTASFNNNPLRYIASMIELTVATGEEKEKRKLRVNEVVKEAMAQDPYTTVQLIIASMARVARF